MSKTNLIQLANFSTEPPKGLRKEEVKVETAKLVERLGELQYRLYAEAKHSVLIILQGMDGSGKDGAAKNVFAECTISALRLEAFKKPTDEEFAHDFLWRLHKVVPKKGLMTIFNRSHYEDILIQRVHGWIDEARVEKRMQAINAFEELLAFDANTLIFKFYMHISYEEQGIQLQQRLDDPTKFWKHNAADWEERKLWDKYIAAYEYAINESTIPWHICPVNNRWYRDYFIAKTLVEGLEKLDMAFPKPAKSEDKRLA